METFNLEIPLKSGINVENAEIQRFANQVGTQFVELVTKAAGKRDPNDVAVTDNCKYTWKGKTNAISLTLAGAH